MDFEFDGKTEHGKFKGPKVGLCTVKAPHNEEDCVYDGDPKAFEVWYDKHILHRNRKTK